MGMLDRPRHGWEGISNGGEIYGNSGSKMHGSDNTLEIMYRQAKEMDKLNKQVEENLRLIDPNYGLLQDGLSLVDEVKQKLERFREYLSLEIIISENEDITDYLKTYKGLEPNIEKLNRIKNHLLKLYDSEKYSELEEFVSSIKEALPQILEMNFPNETLGKLEESNIHR